MNIATMPTAETITANRVAAGLGAQAVPEQDAGPQAQSGRDMATLRAIHAREAAALERFVEVIAELFDCPPMISDAGRNKMRAGFGEARSLARHFGASGEVNGPAPPTARRR